MLTKLAMENLKLLKKPRTYAAPGALLLIIAAMLVGLRYSSQFDYMKETMGQDFIIAGNIVNAAFMCRYLLEGIFFFILPLAVCSICGDLVASEAADGTLRMILTRPISRFSLIATKYIICIAVSFGLTVGAGVIAYLAGLIVLGGGSLFLMPDFRTGEGIWVLDENTALIRMLAAYSLTALGMLAIGSISFMLSTFLSNSNGAIFGAMGFLIISGILGQIEYFDVLKPYLLTTYLDNWQQFFGKTLDTQFLMNSVWALLAYSAIAFILGSIIFRRKDVLV